MVLSVSPCRALAGMAGVVGTLVCDLVDMVMQWLVGYIVCEMLLWGSRRTDSRARFTLSAMAGS